MKKRMAIMLICVLVLLGALVGFNLFKAAMIKKFMAANSAPPVTVSSMKASYQTWQPQLSAVGGLRAVRGVNVTTEIAGLVREVHIKSGSHVKAGQVLVQLNADSDIAQLHALQAQADLAQTVYNRDKKQYELKVIAKATLDADEANLRSTRAQAAQQAAIVEKKTIRAPFSGRLGITTVNPGQYLNPGDMIVTLQDTDTLYADFTLPQQDFSKLAIGQTVVLQNNTYAGKTFTGKITSINPLVDTATRNVQVEAEIDNRAGKLLPGMYATVKVDVGTPQRFLTLPQTAITYNPYGATVFIAKPGTKPNAQGKTMPVAQQVFVTTGATRGDQVAIEKGVTDGEEVITSGQLKLKNGTPLIINNSVLPANSPNPTPQEQ
ncbi:RND transporter [Pandoraea thiooxydans]|uniref:Efflux transporter periplasmic adaptor subunit n=1 Tax=Pandoraea thiooxydans TaxID=445709 RepID=A0A0G3EKS4_9BURK|nr:efflux RND transporter periplasmic adaptor subunit [Pandoraea thiooxydans]AKJ67648.1 efflux transporter periplasmic adaptor subunit [Pandoraea thiooxydans]APR94757.1 RND transporter [Pandoraea thiooxydans]